jgi:hypothetical protein
MFYLIIVLTFGALQLHTGRVRDMVRESQVSRLGRSHQTSGESNQTFLLLILGPLVCLNLQATRVCELHKSGQQPPLGPSQQTPGKYSNLCTVHRMMFGVLELHAGHV